MESEAVLHESATHQLEHVILRRQPEHLSGIYRQRKR